MIFMAVGVLMGPSSQRIICQVSKTLKGYMTFDQGVLYFLKFILMEDNQGYTQRFIHKGIYMALLIILEVM